MATSTRPLHQFDDPAEEAAARHAFVEAALALAMESGGLSFGIADVVRRTGSHNAAFYRVFGSKDALMLAVAAEAARRTATRLERQVPRAPDPAEQVRVWTRVILRLAATPAAAAATHAFSIERHQLLRRFPDSDQVREPIKAVLRDLLRHAEVPDPGLLTDAAFELVMAQQATWLARRHRPTDTEIDWYANLVVRLVGLDKERRRP